MKKISLLAAMVIISGLVLAGFGQKASAAAAEGRQGAKEVKQAPPKADWEKRWEAVLAVAKKEGSVSVYTLWTPDVRTALTKAFKERHGIDLEFTPFSRGSDFIVKVQTEQRAGLFLADCFGAGLLTLVTSVKPAGLLGQIKPLLILPEVLDPRVWRGGELPFRDKDNLTFSMIGAANLSVLYNTQLVKDGEIKTLRDLLKPQYKGKIAMNDPSVTGAGNNLLAHLGVYIWGEADTLDFMRRLMKDQKVVIMRDNRMQVETVARGKYAVALALNPDSVAEFLAAGAPVKMAMIAEDQRATTSSGGVAVPTKLAHPNAASLFINWLLTREGQSVFARGFRNPSNRLDASTEGIDPLYIPVPGKKYYGDSEEVLAATEKWRSTAEKIIAEADK